MTIHQTALALNERASMLVRHLHGMLDSCGFERPYPTTFVVVPLGLPAWSGRQASQANPWQRPVLSEAGPHGGPAANRRSPDQPGCR